MCAIKNGDEIRCDFPSQLCPLVIYLVEKSSRFGSIRALVVPLLVVNRALYPARTSLGALAPSEAHAKFLTRSPSTPQ